MYLLVFVVHNYYDFYDYNCYYDYYYYDYYYYDYYYYCCCFLVDQLIYHDVLSYFQLCHNFHIVNIVLNYSHDY